MTLPNFIGIGAAKCGTTWMHSLLQQHPEIYMPTKRKELDFFNQEQNYSQGLAWYETFFPTSEAAASYRAIGEFTPRYLNSPEVAQRIYQLGTVQKLIVMLRDPVKRTYSQYSHSVRNGYSKSFQDFLADRPYVIDHSRYSTKLEPYLELFAPEQFGFFIFEEAVQDVPGTQEKIADFLGVAPAKFPNQTGPAQANSSYVPKYKWLNRTVKDINQKLRRQKNLSWAVNLAETLQVRQMLQKYNRGTQVPPMTQEMQLVLQDTFSRDIEQLERQLQLDLEPWRCTSS